MKKAPPEAGPKASRKTVTKHYTIGRPDRMPQPRDFGLNLADHQPGQVLWGST